MRKGRKGGHGDSVRRALRTIQTAEHAARRLCLVDRGVTSDTDFIDTALS